MTRRRRILLAVLAAALLLLAGLDALRAPERQVTARLLLGAIHLYQATLSPRMPALGVRCRFTPTCSRYAEAILRARGLPAGAWLTLKRVARCGPWTKDGAIDLPPAASPLAR